MFGRLFGKEKEAIRTQLAMPLLRSTQGLSAREITAAWSALFPARPPLEPGKDEGGAMAFRSDGMDAMVMAMPMRIPTQEVDEAARRSWMWKKELTPRLETYGAHAIVIALGNDGTLESAVASASLVTRVIAAMIHAASGKGECVGVYWGNGGVLSVPGLFKDMAVEMLRDGEAKVTPLWIGLIASGAGPNGPFSVSTYGMNAFGLDDLEVVDSTMPVGDLRMRLYEACSYLLENGPVFKDGQTFGRNETERFKIRMGRSKLGKPGRVVRFEIP